MNANSRTVILKGSSDLSSLIHLVKIVLFAAITVAGLIELFVYPSQSNAVGVFVSVVSLMLYCRFVFTEESVRRRPVSFISFSCLILFMYLPLFATLIDGHEMSHHLYSPVETYVLQLLYFMTCVLAFVCGGYWARRDRSLRKLLAALGIFKTPQPMQLWVMGAVGMLFKLIILANQFSGETVYQSGVGSLSIFAALIYAPLLILFMPIMGGAPVGRFHKSMVLVYLVLLMLLMVGTNSRNQVITALFIVLLCYLLTIFYKRRIRISFIKIATSLLLLLLVFGPLSDLAFAMLTTRSLRNDLKFADLLEATINLYNDKDRLSRYKRMYDLGNREGESLSAFVWSEQYVSSLFLNRVCNYRVADATIYHAERAGFGNAKMREDFVNHLVAMYPQPIINFFWEHFDKSKFAYSSMDKLFAVSRNGPVHVSYIVGGDVGLGMSVFGFFAFVVFFLLYSVEFYLFDSMVKPGRNGKTLISIFTLLLIYNTFFLRFQVGGGLVSHFTFLLYGFPVQLICLSCLYAIVRLVVRW